MSKVLCTTWDYKVNHVRLGGQIDCVQGSITPTQQAGVGPPLPTYVLIQQFYTFSECFP